MIVIIISNAYEIIKIKNKKYLIRIKSLFCIVILIAAIDANHKS